MGLCFATVDPDPILNIPGFGVGATTAPKAGDGEAPKDGVGLPEVKFKFGVVVFAEKLNPEGFAGAPDAPNWNAFDGPEFGALPPNAKIPGCGACAGWFVAPKAPNPALA